MKLQSKQYLQLFNDDGNWIARPDYMVLAEMCVTEAYSVEHIYSTMLLEDRINPPELGIEVSQFGAALRKKFLRSNVKERVLAGEVVLELVRITRAIGEPASVNAARRLVTLNQGRYQSRATPDTIIRDVERSFSLFRATAHLQAVAAMYPNLV